jgi:hypothetical protein
VVEVDRRSASLKAGAGAPPPSAAARLRSASSPSLSHPSSFGSVVVNLAEFGPDVAQHASIALSSLRLTGSLLMRGDPPLRATVALTLSTLTAVVALGVKRIGRNNTSRSSLHD